MGAESVWLQLCLSNHLLSKTALNWDSMLVKEQAPTKRFRTWTIPEKQETNGVFNLSSFQNRHVFYLFLFFILTEKHLSYKRGTMKWVALETGVHSTILFWPSLNSDTLPLYLKWNLSPQGPHDKQHHYETKSTVPGDKQSRRKKEVTLLWFQLSRLVFFSKRFTLQRYRTYDPVCSVPRKSFSFFPAWKKAIVVQPCVLHAVFCLEDGLRDLTQIISAGIAELMILL